MTIQFTAEEQAEMLDSIRRVVSEELDADASDMQARALLKYFCEEIAPFAYNQGVTDAKRFFQQASEDLDGTCFEQGLNYWKKSGDSSKAVRRKL
ncbi:MAG: DUF2164 domain-containing protein [Luteolibacter sp.]